MSYSVAIIGGRGAHARAYRKRTDCELVAVANPSQDSGEAFAAEHGIGRGGVFEDHETMLREVKPDLVSVVTPERSHARLTIDCARAGVAAVHCEKPMAATWGDCVAMARACRLRDTQLTFHHQYRFKPAFRRAKELLDGGAVGDLEQVSYGFPDLFTHGTHSIDLCGCYADESAPEWIMGNVDYREENLIHGIHNENQAMALWEYENGVTGFGATGLGSGTLDERGAFDELDGFGTVHNRIDGSDGTIVVYQQHEPTMEYVLSVRRAGADWKRIGVEDPDETADERAIADVIDALGTDSESELGATNALKSSGILFGVWESARRRGRVEFPLEISDHPLESMVETGDLRPAPADE